MIDQQVKALQIDLADPDKKTIVHAAKYLNDGQAIIFPTDTVYGVGVAAQDKSNPSKLFQIKQRDLSKAIPWLVLGVSDLKYYAKNLQPYCLEMATKLWPGPLTLVVEAAPTVPKAFMGDDSTIALRAPNSPVALSLMHELSSPIATTSANISGRDAVNNSSNLDPEICELVSVVLDGGEIKDGMPSTVVICTEGKPKVVREGAITKAQIMSFVEA